MQNDFERDITCVSKWVRRVRDAFGLRLRNSLLDGCPIIIPEQDVVRKMINESKPLSLLEYHELLIEAGHSEGAASGLGHLRVFLDRQQEANKGLSGFVGDGVQL